MYCKLDTAIIDITRSFGSEYNNSPHFEIYTENRYCSASEVRHPSEVRHLHFMTILKSFYCPVTAFMYTLPLKEAIPVI